jgi:hypothetical protein
MAEGFVDRFTVVSPTAGETRHTREIAASDGFTTTSEGEALLGTDTITRAGPDKDHHDVGWDRVLADAETITKADSDKDHWGS